MKMPYKIQDKEGHIFVFAGYSSGFPIYRTNRGVKHIFESQIQFYKILEQEMPQ